MTNIVATNLDDTVNQRTFADGSKRTVVVLASVAVGRGEYLPGWKWSEDVGPDVGETYCSVEHVGLVLSGVATAAFSNGEVTEMSPGQLFYIPSEPHDSWVVGDEPYVSLHFMGANKYAR